MEEFIVGKLRAELRLHAKELQDRHGVTQGKHLTPSIIQSIFNQYLGKIDMANQVTLHDEQLVKLPRTLLGTYQLWRQGADVRGLLSRSTYSRHRRELQIYGIDIAAMPADQETNNVVPLIRIIEAVPVSTPKWMYERGLIAA